jgi:hypothetical protein
MGLTKYQKKILEKAWEDLKELEILRITGIIEKDITSQVLQLKGDFEKDKIIKWRIEGMRSLLNKIKGNQNHGKS